MPTRHAKIERGENGKHTRAPRNKIASKSYHEHYGKLLAEQRLWEIKAALFGRIWTVDRLSDTEHLSKGGFKNTSRKDTYRKAMQVYNEDELVRPIINLIASSVFAPSRRRYDCSA